MPLIVGAVTDVKQAESAAMITAAAPRRSGCHRRRRLAARTSATPGAIRSATNKSFGPFRRRRRLIGVNTILFLHRYRGPARRWCAAQIRRWMEAAKTRRQQTLERRLLLTLHMHSAVLGAAIPGIERPPEQGNLLLAPMTSHTNTVKSVFPSFNGNIGSGRT
jgi:hypothetical protein